MPPASNPHKTLLLIVALEASVVVAAWALSRLLRVSLGDAIRPGPRGALLGLAACLPLLAQLMLCRQVRRGPIGRLNRLVEEHLVPLFRHATVAEVAVVSLFAGVGEEMLFRGVFQTYGQLRLNALEAVAISSLLFGLLHALSLTYVVWAALVGAYLGWLFWATDDLTVPMTAHAVYDFLAILWIVHGAPKREVASEGEMPE